MKKLAIPALVAAGAIAVPALVSPALAAKTYNVTGTSSDTWSPSKRTVKLGDTIRFRWNNTGAPHNVVKKKGKGSLKGGKSVVNKGSATFKAPAKGTYRFICEVHPGTMKFTLTVK